MTYDDFHVNKIAFATCTLNDTIEHRTGAAFYSNANTSNRHDR